MAATVKYPKEKATIPVQTDANIVEFDTIKDIKFIMHWMKNDDSNDDNDNSSSENEQEVKTVVLSHYETGRRCFPIKGRHKNYDNIDSMLSDAEEFLVKNINTLMEQIKMYPNLYGNVT